jgi:hypothetical protein
MNPPAITHTMPELPASFFSDWSIRTRRTRRTHQRSSNRRESSDPKQEKNAVLRPNISAFFDSGRDSKISCGNLLFLNLLMKVSDSSGPTPENAASHQRCGRRRTEGLRPNASAFFEPFQEIPVI